MTINTPEKQLLEEAASENDVERLKQLLATGICPNPKAGTGEGSPLIYACDAGNICAAEILLAHGADVNYQSEFGDSPLFCAVGNGNLELVQLLLKAGANPLQSSYLDSDLTPLNLARREGNQLIVDAMELIAYSK